MTVYLHRFSGTFANGDGWGFGWHSQNALSLPASHANAVTWINDLWNGVGAGPALKAHINTAQTLLKITSYQLDPLTSKTVAVAEDDVSLAGTGVGNPLPPNVSMVVSLRSLTPGRVGRGRFYLPSFTTGELSATGELTTAAQTAVSGALQAAWSASNGAGEVPIVYSKTTTTARPITRFAVGTVMNTQQRRTEKAVTVREFTDMPA